MLAADNGLGNRCRKTLLADDMEFHAVADDLAGYILTYGPHQTLDCRVSELSHSAAANAEGMVVVFDAGKAVLGRTVREDQFADHSSL